MKLSIRNQYACLAMIELAENYGKGYIRIRDIAGHKRIPPKFLEKILMTLKVGGYLISRRGNNGGYILARPPEKISLAEIVRLIDGPLAPVPSASKHFYQPAPVEENEKLTALFKEIRYYIAEKMENTSFADLV
jgi:Rrf2 family cysteine metabolism transcriptional repressor